MDPFTITTGVAGFLSLALDLVTILKEYTGTVRSAPSDAQTLLTEITSLSQVFQQLTNFLKKPEHNINYRDTSVLCSVVTICDVKIKKLYAKLDKFRSDGRLGRWRWPFEKQDCLDIAQTLHHCAQTIELSMTISNGELLCKTSQELTTALTESQRHNDMMFKLIQNNIPRELQQMQDNISTVLRFVPTIDQLASDIQQVKDGVLQLQRQNKDTQLRSIQGWLSSLEPHKRHQDIKSARIKNTGEWVLETQAYHGWINQGLGSTPKERILSCYGMPGAGKTFIASMMIDHLFMKRAGNPKIGIAYLYCDYRDQKNQSIANIIGTITNQLLELLTDNDFDDIGKEVAAHREEERDATLESNMRILKLVLNKLDQTFIHLDAVDELETVTQAALMNSLKEVLTISYVSVGTLLFLTARPHVKDMVTQFLGNNPHSVTITANDEDIQKYILGQLEVDPHPKLISPDLKDQLLTTIPSNSKGMFLLAALQIQVVLQELTIAQRKAAIQKLPTELYAAFQLSLERIRTYSPRPARVLGMKVLMWTYLAKRQLHIKEVLHALAVEDGASDLDEENIPLMETVIHCCNGLVVIDHETSSVRLVHYSLQEFFQKHGSDYFQDGHREIARTCLTYLNFTPLLTHCTTMEQQVHLFMSYHLLGYAATYWGHHAFYDQQFDNTMETLSLRLLVQEPPTTAVKYCCWINSAQCLDRGFSDTYGTWRAYSAPDWSPEYPDEGCGYYHGFYVAVCFGLENIVRNLLNKESGNESPMAQGGNPIESSLIKSTDFYGRTALYIAAQSGYTGIVCLLLRQPNIVINAVSRFGDAPLGQAAKKGHDDIVRVLLEHPDIDIKAGNPLAEAARYGHEKIVRILLEHPDIDVNAQTPLEQAVNDDIVRVLLEHPDIDIKAGNPLAQAANFGHENIVRILLEHPGIDVNAGAPLAQAANFGYENIVRLLLEHPDIDVNAGKPLARAARTGHEKIVRILLEHPDIDVNAQTPLEQAANFGYENIVRLLLEHPDLDVNAGTPLVYVAVSGDEQIVRLLLEHPDIDVNAGAPLAAAASSGHENIVRLLLEHPDINVNKPSVWEPWTGMTPYMLAHSRGHESVCRLLLADSRVHENARSYKRARISRQNCRKTKVLRTRAPGQ